MKQNTLEVRQILLCPTDKTTLSLAGFLPLRFTVNNENEAFMRVLNMILNLPIQILQRLYN